MRKFWIVLCCLVLLAGCSSTQPQSSQSTTEGIELTADLKANKVVSDGSLCDIRDLSISLFQQLQSEDNVVLSPFSMFICLSMIANGTDGQTRTDYQQAFGYSLETINQYYAGLIEELTDTSESTKLQIANSGWLSDQAEVKQEFLQTITDYYQAQIFQTDLTSQQTVEEVNLWVKEKTDGLIEEVLDEPFSADTLAALINTIYFDADWLTAFDSNLIEMEFTSLNGSSSNISFMYSQEPLDVYEDDSLLAVIKEYDDQENVMILLQSKDTFNSLVESLSASLLQQILDEGKSEDVRLYLPEIDVTYQQTYQALLADMGFASLFEQTADFSLMAEGAYLSDIYQKARIKIDTEGTQAAAVTVGTVRTTSLEPDSKTISFDEPFIYIIYNRPTDTVLFIGDYTNAG